jgi:hypothetical protein
MSWVFGGTQTTRFLPVRLWDLASGPTEAEPGQLRHQNKRKRTKRT